MAYTITILHEFHLVYRKMTGIYDDHQLRAAAAEWQEMNPTGNFNTFDRLIDFTDVTEYQVSVGEIKRLAEYYIALFEQQELPARRIAYVAPSPVAYGTGRVYEAWSKVMDTDIREFHVFADLAEACEWLDIDISNLKRALQIQHSAIPLACLDDHLRFCGPIKTTKHECYVEYCFSGTFDDQNMYQAFYDLWMAPDYELIPEILDYRNVDFKAITSVGVNRIASLNERLHTGKPTPRVALLVVDDLQFGISRMGAATNEFRNPNIRVFRDRDEAVAWVSSGDAHSNSS